MIEIREASIADIEGINLVSSYLGYEASSIEESSQRLENILASESHVVWVGVENNRVKGWLHLFVAMRLASPTFAEIGGLVVDQSCRRSGIGKRLVAEAIQWATLNKLTLRVRCNAKREEANRFYESLGFANEKAQQVHELPFHH